MFKMIDTDNSGQITFEELKVGLEKVGAKLKESEIYALMQAVSLNSNLNISVSIPGLDLHYQSYNCWIL